MRSAALTMVDDLGIEGRREIEACDLGTDHRRDGPYVEAWCHGHGHSLHPAGTARSTRSAPYRDPAVLCSV